MMKNIDIHLNSSDAMKFRYLNLLKQHIQYVFLCGDTECIIDNEKHYMLTTKFPNKYVFNIYLPINRYYNNIVDLDNLKKFIDKEYTLNTNISIDDYNVISISWDIN